MGETLSSVIRFVYLIAIIIVILGASLTYAIQSFLRREREHNEDSSRESRIALIGIILAIAVASFAYRWLVGHHLEQTSALFIGLPTTLAIIVVLAGRPKSATGMACMVTALALLISGIFLGEGFVCILMASPIFFGVAALIGGAIDTTRKLRKKNEITMSCLILVLMIPMSLEGVIPRFSFPREQSVSVERVIAGNAQDIRQSLASIPKFDSKLPTYLRLGFPRPLNVAGEGLNVGDERVIHFAGGEGKPGDLVLKITEADDHHVIFRAVSDTSHVAHWLSWESAEVEWSELDPKRTRVGWRMRYHRSLDPAWYFGPWERYAVRLATNYLVENVAAPHR
ncbi:MAG TPA: hypothetical protein VFA74_13520 [Terriglobales bacterium]|nr:hypothetical protein [Terriglobales bacterium]